MESVKNLITYSKLLYDRGYVIATDGNLSIRKKHGILITPTGKIKYLIKKEDLVFVNFNGQFRGKKPSMEVNMHLNIYKKNENINAIMHAHPLYTLAYFFEKKEINFEILPEIREHVVNFSVLDYFPAGSRELAQNVCNNINGENGIIVLKKHGVVAYGLNFDICFSLIERLEFFIKFLFLTGKMI